MTDRVADVLVVGAGVSGLACARAVHRAGRTVVVLDRARGVGGRCSTWRTDDGHSLDYGTTFFHGSDPAFLRALDELDDRIEGWPHRIKGQGVPCQPRALAAHERRVGIVGGVSAFPKHLAAGLDVRLETRVERLIEDEGGLGLETSGMTLRAETVVLAVACEQARDLLRSLSARDESLDGVQGLLGMLGTVPSLTVLATYGPHTLDWDLMLPADSQVVQVISNESAKRPRVRGTALVIQGRPAWSSRNLETPQQRWGEELLQEAARYVAPWVEEPVWIRHHRWRYGRTDIAQELADPIVVDRGSSRLGLTGELFTRGAGVQAAYLAGRALARHICGDDDDR